MPLTTQLRQHWVQLIRIIGSSAGQLYDDQGHTPRHTSWPGHARPTAEKLGRPPRHTRGMPMIFVQVPARVWPRSAYMYSFLFWRAARTESIMGKSKSKITKKIAHVSRKESVQIEGLHKGTKV